MALLVDQIPALTFPLGAGLELEAAQLLGQRWLLEGVVLAAGEHAPEQAGELARGGDDCDLVAAAGADARPVALRARSDHL